MIAEITESVEKLKEEVKSVLREFKLFKTRYQEREQKFLGIIEERFSKQLNNILKTEKHKQLKYYIQRIDFLCKDLNRIHDERYIKLLENNRALKERVDELSIKNEYYKKKNGT